MKVSPRDTNHAGTFVYLMCVPVCPKKLWIRHGCKNCIISDNQFKCKVTGRVYHVRGSLPCPNIVYIIFCKNCGDQYRGSTSDFKARFRIHKSDIKTKKDRCSSVRHFNMCCERNNPHIFLQIQLIESVQSVGNLEGKLWESEKY